MSGQVSAARHSETSAAAKSSLGASSAQGRYALALYELAAQQNAIEQVIRDLTSLSHAIRDSAPLQQLLTKPLIKSLDQTHALNALADKMGAATLTKKFLGVLIRNRRLPLLSSIIQAFFALHHERQGEVTAEVTAASTLTDLQTRILTDNLQATLKHHVVLKVTEDKTLLGGLVVKIGSRLFDGSLRNKLDRLRRVLTEAA